MEATARRQGEQCSLRNAPSRLYKPQAEDILSDEDLLDLFRIVRQVMRRRRDSERLSRLFFCISYALGDHVKFYRPLHETRLYFADDTDPVAGVSVVQLPPCTACCPQKTDTTAFDGHHRHDDPAVAAELHRWPDSSSMISSSSSGSSASPLPRMLSLPYVIDPTTTSDPAATAAAAAATAATTTTAAPTSSTSERAHSSSDEVSTDAYTVRPYTHFRHFTSSAVRSTHNNGNYPLSQSADKSLENGDIVAEPKQRGFYYQDGRIAREPVLLQRYAEHGVLTHASLMRKRKRQHTDQHAELLSPIPLPTKKPKIPHRHGEFEQRRDDIINRLRIITMADLEEKASRLPEDYSLAIDQAPLPQEPEDTLSPERKGELLRPALEILTSHSNMKPHLDNGMNQNGIYYNTDYFRLYLAFEQFQRTFAVLFPKEVSKVPEWNDKNATEKDRDKERNANMKAYRPWIEPLLMDTNWAAFRRNIVVGERMMQLTKVVGQGVLLITKELSGSKIHLTFTNNEWDEFINGLFSGKWDETINWESRPSTNGSILVSELQEKFATRLWFQADGRIVPPNERKGLLNSDSKA